MKPFSHEVIATLQSGGIAVIPTDTIYGIVGQALSRTTVERIYHVRERSSHKPCIILIASFDDLTHFGISLNAKDTHVIESEKLWPGPTSIVLPCPEGDFSYLTRGAQSLTFRMPAIPELRYLITHTGPLIAPSANKEGYPPATTIAEARDIFGDAVDAYVDGGTRSGPPSRIVRLENGILHTLRP